jgi:hypothetical protein
MSNINTSSPANDGSADKKPGRPVNPESARQKRERELSERRERGELTLGRPKVADSKRQQELALKAAKAAEGHQAAKGRPKMTDEQKAEARKKREAEQLEARLRWAQKNGALATTTTTTKTTSTPLVTGEAIIHVVADEDVVFTPNDDNGNGIASTSTSTNATLTVELDENDIQIVNEEVVIETEPENADVAITTTAVGELVATGDSDSNPEEVTLEVKQPSAKQRKQARQNAKAVAAITTQNNEEDQNQ